MRTIVFRGLYWGPLILRNYHIYIYIYIDIYIYVHTYFRHRVEA